MQTTIDFGPRWTESLDFSGCLYCVVHEARTQQLPQCDAFARMHTRLTGLLDASPSNFTNPTVGILIRRITLVNYGVLEPSCLHHIRGSHNHRAEAKQRTAALRARSVTKSHARVFEPNRTSGVTGPSSCRIQLGSHLHPQTSSIRRQNHPLLSTIGVHGRCPESPDPSAKNWRGLEGDWARATSFSPFHRQAAYLEDVEAGDYRHGD